mgnify:CR=1 FL=1|jgi:hypothetical protein
MKRISYIFIIIALSLALSGCGAKEKMQEKIAEKVIEHAVGDSNMDIDGEEVTIKTEGGTYTLGATEWPDTKLASKIPEFKKGKVANVMTSEAYFIVIVDEVSEKDFMDYYEKVKGEFNEEPYETKSDDSIAYMGKNGEEISVILSYSMGDSTVSISASMPEKQD